MVSGSGGGRSAAWLLIAVLAVFGTIAVLRAQSSEPEAPASATSQARPGPLPGAVSLDALPSPLPSPLPDESATGGAPSGELSVVDQPPGAVPVTAPPGPGGAPGTAVAAYQHAERMLAVSAPACRLSWPMLAALGRAASGHARGGQLDAHGRTLGRFLGPRLDGSPGLPRVPDTDRGELDGDPRWDRAVGPMQIIPSTWRRYAADGDGDGQADPNDMSDAALTAGRYLCAGNANLAVPEQETAAYYRVNRSDSYVRAVRSFTTEYSRSLGATPAPPLAMVVPPVAATAPPAALPKPASTHRAKPVHRPAPAPSASKRTSSTTGTPAPTSSATPATATSRPPVRPNRILAPTSNGPTTAGAPAESTPITQPPSSTPSVPMTIPASSQQQPTTAPGAQQQTATGSKPIPIIVLPPTDSAPK